MIWRILLHSYQMIANNLSEVIRIAFVPWLATVILILMSNVIRFGHILPEAEDIFNAQKALGGYFFITLVFAVIIVCIYLWVVVGWHRFILLGETSNNYLPNWHGGCNLWYFLSVIIVLLTLVIPVIMISMIFYVGHISMESIVVQFIIGVLVVAVSLRISLVLPAAAIGKPMKIRVSWDATRNINTTIWGLAITSVFLNITISSFEQIMPVNAFGIFGVFVFNTIYGLFSVSVLTTMYGVLVEKREL